VRQELKAKSASGKMTDIEERELRLLDYPASKQFLVSVVGALREEVAGTRVSSPEAFELVPNAITIGGREAVEAWVKVLKSILPVMVQNLPAEKYQVVRSTEHADAVANKTKGVVVGAGILRTNFEDLRKLLKPI
jgi:hypothetical protein